MTEYKTISDAWDDPNKTYPSIVYVETINHCNYHCGCCPIDVLNRPKGLMSLETFKVIADKVKAKGLKIGAMFCMGEPLMDPTLIQKMEYAKSIGVFPSGHYGFNTNGSLMKPELYEGIMKNTTNITFSFYNTGEEYEKMTKGGFSFEQVYDKVIDFINYRDTHYPNFEIFLGVNKVPGNDLGEVEKAFKNYRVKYAVSANNTYHENGMLTGILDKTVMHPALRCDGHMGAMQIKWDGGCEYCAFDQIGTKEGGYTKIGNILEDDWETLNQRFKEKWKEGSYQCKRCDYWNRAGTVIANCCKYPNPLPDDWDDWQKPFLKEGEEIIKQNV